MKKYLKTARMSALEKMNGGVVYLLPDILLKIFTLIALLFLWRTVLSSGADAGMSRAKMMTYTTVSSLLSELLVVETAASGWMSEGVILKLYGRPLPVFAQLAAQTAGRWVPMLLFFSLPAAAVTLSLGVNLTPASPLFFLSLLLCVTLGFAVDLLMACLSIKLRNMSWLIGRLRSAIATVLSGTVIPIRLLPFGMDRVMKYQPFASLGGAPLSVFAGTADTGETVALQIFWNMVLWPIALFVWKKSQEGMVSYGG